MLMQPFGILITRHCKRFGLVSCNCCVVRLLVLFLPASPTLHALDGLLQDFEHDYIDLWIFILFTCVSGVGIMLAVVASIFDLVFRNKQ